MMRNKLFLSFVIASLIALPSFSLADSATSSNAGAKAEEREQKREVIRNRIEETKENLKQKLEQKREEVMNSAQERKQNAVDKITERVNRFILNVISRYEAAMGRLDGLVARIESRIAKIEAGGIDESEAKELLAEAKTKIEIARASVLDIASTTDSVSFGTTTISIKGDFEAIKTQMNEAKDDIKAAHAALVDVVNSLKPGDNKFRLMQQASSTATTTDSD